MPRCSPRLFPDVCLSSKPLLIVTADVLYSVGVLAHWLLSFEQLVCSVTGSDGLRTGLLEELGPLRSAPSLLLPRRRKYLAASPRPEALTRVVGSPR